MLDLCSMCMQNLAGRGRNQQKKCKTMSLRFCWNKKQILYDFIWFNIFSLQLCLEALPMVCWCGWFYNQVQPKSYKIIQNHTKIIQNHTKSYKIIRNHIKSPHPVHARPTTDVDSRADNRVCTEQFRSGWSIEKMLNMCFQIFLKTYWIFKCVLDCAW